MHFLCGTLCTLPEVVSGSCSYSVGKKSLKTVVDEVHFRVNLCSFLLPPPSHFPGKPFLPSDKSCAPSQAKQLPKIPPPLGTLTKAVACIFPTVLSHN